MFRHLLREFPVVAAATVFLLIEVPDHPIAVILAIDLVWIVLQLVGACAFMIALYRHEILEFQSTPLTYALAPRAKVGWLARRFMLLYLRAGPYSNTPKRL
jgi:hypothetical protein